MAGFHRFDRTAFVRFSNCVYVARRGDELAYYQVSLQISSPETYEREYGNLKRIIDNHPKYVITMDPMAQLVNDDGIITFQASEFLL